MKWKNNHILTHISGGVEIRTLIMTSELTISVCLSVELKLIEFKFFYWCICWYHKIWM